MATSTRKSRSIRHQIAQPFGIFLSTSLHSTTSPTRSSIYSPRRDKSHWHMLASIPKGVLGKLKRICANYLWKGSIEYKGAHLACWDLLTRSMKFGAWGIKNLNKFGRSLAIISLFWVLTKENIYY